MPVNVMYIGYQPYFVDLANEMTAHDWQPVYWSVTPQVEDLVKKNFPDVVCHNHFDAIKGRPAKPLSEMETEEVCPTILARLCQCQRISLRMFERNDSHTSTFSYKERFELYRDLVAYWIKVLELLKPEYVVFEEEPHQVSDFVLYSICKLQGIATVMFIRTKFRERMYPVRHFESGSKIILAAYKQRLAEYTEQEVTMSEELTAYFEGISGSYDNAISLHLYDQVSEVKKLTEVAPGLSDSPSVISIGARFKFLLTRLKSRYKLLIATPGIGFLSDQKQRGKRFKDSDLTYIEHVYYKIVALRRKARLKKYYMSLAVADPDLSVPYIFCALHYQPEKTTCPLGGDFDDQLYMIKMLSQVIPKHWKLLVKDHPSQFVGSYTRYGEVYRSENFYDTLIALENVQLLPLTSDTFKLVDNAQAVATVTGTTSWEAVIRGIPGIVFGDCWYQHCEGVYRVSSRDQLVDAISDIESGRGVDVQKVKLFANVVEEHSYHGLVGGPGLRKYFDVSNEANGKAHAQAILDLIEYERLSAI